MAVVGYHASHEQHPPERLLTYVRLAEQAGFDAAMSSVLAGLRLPADFEAAAAFVQPGDLRGPVLVSSDLARHTAWLADYAALGFDELYLHDVHRDQERLLNQFAEHVLPELQA